jgi:hypothetical protein
LTYSAACFTGEAEAGFTDMGEVEEVEGGVVGEVVGEVLVCVLV